MALIATLVVGANQATSKGGLSAPLSTGPDRQRFLALHRSAGAIIIGKESAAAEDYSQTKVPIYLFTRSEAVITLPHPLMEQVVISPSQGGELARCAREIDSRTTGDVVVEAGAQLLKALVEVGAVDFLHLSRSPIEGDGDFLDLNRLLSYFEIESERDEAGTALLQCRYKGDATNS